MSWLQRVLILKDKLYECKDDKNSRLWCDVRSVIEHILGDPHPLQTMFENKDTWFNHGALLTLDFMLRFLAFYGDFSQLLWFKSFPERNMFLKWMQSTANGCCIALENIELMSESIFMSHECVLHIAFSGHRVFISFLGGARREQKHSRTQHHLVGLPTAIGWTEDRTNIGKTHGSCQCWPTADRCHRTDRKGSDRMCHRSKILVPRYFGVSEYPGGSPAFSYCQFHESRILFTDVQTHIERVQEITTPRHWNVCELDAFDHRIAGLCSIAVVGLFGLAVFERGM